MSSYHTYLFATTILIEMMRKNVAISIRNVQKYCSSDVLKCPGGKSIIDKMKAKNGGDNDAVTIWSSSHFHRHAFSYAEEIPLGYGDAADDCLRKLSDREEKIEQSKRLAPKCDDWISKTNDYFYAYLDREESDDMREWVVIFATLFAMTLSAAVGYMIGIYQKEHEDILAFSYERRRESKKIFVILALAVAIPACIVLFTCPKLLVLMTITFVLGRAALWYKLRKEDVVAYSALSGDSGLVFAAIPVQMD